MDKNKKELFRGAIGKITDKIQLQEVAKLKAPFVLALQQIALRQQQQHEVGGYYGDYSQLPGYTEGKDDIAKKIKYTLPTIKEMFDPSRPENRILTPRPGKPLQKKKPTIPKPEYKLGGIPSMSNNDNLAVSTLGGITAMKQYLDARNQDIYTPDIFLDNPYKNQILNTLASMRISPYGPMRQIQDMNRRGMYAINNQGGLSGGLKYYANVASMLGTQQNIANALMAAQEQNNKYLGAYAEAAQNLGKEYASNRLGANQYATEYASKAHAAKLQGMQMGQQNFLSQLQQYIANKNKIDMYNGMRSIYQQDIENDKLKIKNSIKG